MKLLNGLKLVGVALVAAQMVGCVSPNSIVQKTVDDGVKLSKNGSGIIFGVASENKDFASAEEMCSQIKNNDERCREPEKYKPAGVAGRVGYWDGFQGLAALAPKDMEFKHIRSYAPDVNNMTYVKALAVPGKFGTILEIADKGGEGKCTWEGMPAYGGTVCPAYGWDYRKDMVLENIVRH